MTIGFSYSKLQGGSRAVIDTARVGESARNPCQLSISWTSQDIDSSENNTKYVIKMVKCRNIPACRWLYATRNTGCERKSHTCSIRLCPCVGEGQKVTKRPLALTTAMPIEPVAGDDVKISDYWLFKFLAIQIESKYHIGNLLIDNRIGKNSLSMTVLGGSSITSMIFFPIKTKLSLLLLHVHFSHNAWKNYKENFSRRRIPFQVHLKRYIISLQKRAMYVR